MALEVLLVVIGRSFVFVAAEEMPGSCIPEAFLHIVSGNSFGSGLDVTLFIPCIVYLIFKLLHMFELGIFP